MRILVISNLYPPEILGGYEILCEQVCRELVKRGHQLRVLSTGNDFSQAEVERCLRLYLPFSQIAKKDRLRSLLVYWHNAFQTRKRIAEFEPEVIFCWSQLRLTLGALHSAQSSGRPMLYTINDEHLVGYLPSSGQEGLRSWMGWLLDRSFFRHLTLLHRPLPVTTTISRKVAENLERLGVELTANRVIYQGIPIESFPLKEHPGSLSDPLRILYVGQLHSYKGVHRILEALRMLKGKALLSIIGDGPEDYKEVLRGLCQGLEVKFYGRVSHSELPELYRRHDVFVFPSIWEEPFGLTHLEAMASGLPVISTVNGGQGEFLVHEENCLAVPPDDAGAIHEALERLCHSPEFAAKIALNGRRTVEARLTLKRYIDEIENFLQELAYP